METIQATLALLMALGFSILAGAAADGITSATRVQAGAWLIFTAMSIALAFLAGGVML